LTDGVGRDLAERVKEAVDIVDVISETIPLRRAGKRYAALCPFHPEKTPSFFVNPERQFFYCFGCGAGGDVIQFIMKHRGLSFAEAIRYLADRYGISIPERSTSSNRSSSQKNEYLDLLEKAKNFYHHTLLYDSNGKKALDYLKSRGIPEKLIRDEELGYAPDDWDALVQHFRQGGLDTKLGEEAGLFVTSSKGSLYDRFRNRVIFPIRDTRGRVVAFGGRSIDGSDPKYLNSPETPVYRKRALLYQLDRAERACRSAKKGERHVFLVEGYMDALAFHRVGEYRVVATLGTAFTAQQARLLRRIADEVILVYDGDDAGKRAMLRIFPFLIQERLKCSCIVLPDGLDPDDFLSQRGWDEFELLVAKRTDLGRFVIDEHVKIWDGSATGKLEILHELFLLFQNIADPLLQSEYMRLVTERLDVSPDVISKQFRKWRGVKAKVSLPAESDLVVTSTSEEGLVKLLIKYPYFVKEISEHDFNRLLDTVTSAHGTILRGVREEWLFRKDEFDIQRVYERIDDQVAKAVLSRYMVEDSVYGNTEQAFAFFKDYLAACLKKSITVQREKLKERLSEAEQRGDFQAIRDLLRQLQTLDCHFNKGGK